MMMMMMIINWLTISLFSLLFTVSCLSAKSIFTRQEMDLVPKYNTSHLKLFRPSLSSFAPKLEEKLKALFEHVTVSVVDCPDLSRKPFNLAGKAIGGRTAIADIGGVGLLMPLPKKPYPTYSLVKISQEMGKLIDYLVNVFLCINDDVFVLNRFSRSSCNGCFMFSVCCH